MMKRTTAWLSPLILTFPLLGACAIDGPTDLEDGEIPAADPTDPVEGGAEGDEPGPGDVVGEPENSDGGGGGGGGETTPDPDPDHDDPHVCYPGPDSNYSVCLPVKSKDGSFGSGYNYPSSGSAAYQPPLRFVDLDAADPNLQIAPNFALGELMQAYKGRYGVYQVHMVERLQAIRTETGGALHINSGYRNPSYNASVGGASLSRHMYGDAADMWSSVVSLSSMKSRCEAKGADYVGMYTSHIHCDWRYATKDTAFYGNAQASIEGTLPVTPLPAHDATLVAEAGWLSAPATGFEEGEPYREWTSFDDAGEVIEVVASSHYAPPPEAHTVEVMIGGQLTLEVPVADPGAATKLLPGLVQVRLPTLADPSQLTDIGAHLHE